MERGGRKRVRGGREGERGGGRKLAVRERERERGSF